MLTDKVFSQFGQNNINFTQNSGPSNAPLSILDAIGGTILMINFTLGRINSLGAGTTRYSANSSSSTYT
jgi:hypothetical protein